MATVSGNLSQATAQQQTACIKMEINVLPRTLDADGKVWQCGLLLAYDKAKDAFKPAEAGKADAVLNAETNTAQKQVAEVVCFGAVKKDLLKVGVDNPQAATKADFQALASNKIFAI